MSAPDIARALADRAEDVCRYLLPNGRRVGHEWKCGSVEGEAGDSLGVRLTGEKSGLWADFGGDESGDLIGLWKAARRVDVATACAEAEEWLGLEPRRNGHQLARVPARPVAPIAEPSHVHSRYGKPSAVWAYRDAGGGILGYVCRFDPAGERKQVLPQTWTAETGWQWKGFADPRPLYGLDKLAARPEAPVLIVEGEKCADAAAALLGAMVVVSWPGGCKAINTVDWSPLRGRVCTLWPDADDAGKAAMQALAEKLGMPCRIVRPNGQADGWDVADAAAEGWDTARVQEWARGHVEEWFPEPEPDLIEETHERVADWHPPTMIEGEAWPEPTNFLEQAPLPKLARSCVPDALADMIFDQSEIIGSDPCILAMSVLIACAAVTSDTIRLQPKEFEYGWTEPARLWGAFVGDPSVKKSPPMARATSHLRKLDADFSERAAEDLHRYKIAKRVYEAMEKRYVDAQAKNQPCSPLPNPPDRPPLRRIVMQDATIEAIADVLSDNPQGILVLFDELAGFFGSMDAYRGTGASKDRSFWLEAYNGGPRRVDRVSREARFVPNLSACILGGIQPSAIRAKAADMVEDGLLQRFMIVCAEGGSSIGEDRRADTGAMQRYRSVLDYLVTCDGDPERPLTFDAEAMAVFKRIEKRLDGFIREDRLPLRMRLQLGKWSGLFARLCLTYWGIECANLGQPIAGQVTADVAERVEAFMFEYLFWHLKWFYEGICGDSTSVTDAARKVALWVLAKQPERITSSALSQGVRGWRGLSWRSRRDVIDTLETCGWVIPEPGRGSSRSSMASWKVNTRIFEAFKELGETERKRRESIVEAIMFDAGEKREQAKYER